MVQRLIPALLQGDNTFSEARFCIIRTDGQSNDQHSAGAAKLTDGVPDRHRFHETSLAYDRNIVVATENSSLRGIVPKGIEDAVSIDEKIQEYAGNTPTAQDIREGYNRLKKEQPNKRLRPVRGDQYCALRATLFIMMRDNLDHLVRAFVFLNFFSFAYFFKEILLKNTYIHHSCKRYTKQKPLKCLQNDQKINGRTDGILPNGCAL